MPSDGKRTLKHRDYDVSNYDAADAIIQGIDGTPMAGCFFNVKGSQWNKQPWKSETNRKLGRWATRNGLKEMYHFRFHPRMPRHTVAVRRIPCLCDKCYTQLGNRFVEGTEMKKQPMFARVKGWES